MDVLTEVLHDLRLSGSFYCRSELRDPWGLEIPARDCASFHVVVDGSAWIRSTGEQLRLDAGDLVLLPRGSGHSLSSPPHARTVRIDTLKHESIGKTAMTLRYGGKGKRATVICGGATFEGAAFHPILQLMPEMLLIRGKAGQSEKWVQNTIEMMGVEATAPRPGTPTVITHLADILVIQAIRGWIEKSAGKSAGWLRALRDPQIGLAIALIHRRPRYPWTVALLASEVHLSRSVFSERFTEMVGASPIHYLRRWRMDLASDWIRDEKLRLGEVAVRIGYESEAGFSRAFKRQMGVSPGAVRRRP
jgi:AraC-like DNA-binding protein